MSWSRVPAGLAERWFRLKQLYNPFSFLPILLSVCRDISICETWKSKMTLTVDYMTNLFDRHCPILAGMRHISLRVVFHVESTVLVAVEWKGGYDVGRSYWQLTWSGEIVRLLLEPAPEVAASKSDRISIARLLQ